MNYALIAILTIWVIFMSVMMFQGKVMRYFNLVDRRQFIGSEASHKKLNSMMEVGQVSIYSFVVTDKPTVSVNVSYKQTENESADGRFTTSTFDESIAKAYEWSVQRGFIKE